MGNSQHRLLLLNTDLLRGGTPTVVRELAMRLNNPTVDVEVACLAKWGPVADDLKAAGVPVTALGATGAADMGAIGRLSRLIRERRYDTVFSFLMHANAAAALTSAIHSRVRYFQSIQTTQPYPRWHWLVQAASRLAARRIIVPSQSIADCAAKWSMIPHAKFTVIPNALDPARMKTGQSIAKSPDEGLFRLGFLGRLDPVKRVVDLVEAVSLLPSHYELHIYGEGEDRIRIQTTIARLNLGSRVILHGQVLGPEVALAQIDLLILPSLAEGAPMVLIEAMAAGVPIVATDAPGIRDLVTNGQTGLLVPVAAPAALAEAIKQLSQDQSLRTRLSENARQKVLDHYTWERVIPQYQRALELD